MGKIISSLYPLHEDFKKKYSVHEPDQPDMDVSVARLIQQTTN